MKSIILIVSLLFLISFSGGVFAKDLYVDVNTDGSSNGRIDFDDVLTVMNSMGEIC